jgi:hypothetical protein
VILIVVERTHSPNGNGWIMNAGAALQAAAPPRDYPVQHEKDDRSDDSGDEAGAFTGFVPADRMAEPAGQKRAGDA